MSETSQTTMDDTANLGQGTAGDQPPAPYIAPVSSAHVPKPVPADPAPTDPNDPAHPDFTFEGGQGVASKDDVSTAIAHMKAWFKREFGRG